MSFWRGTTGRWAPAAAVGVSVACGLFAASIVTFGTGKPETATVTRGSVRASLDAAGALHHLAYQGMGFPAGGTLVSLNVAVGDNVVVGQAVAAVDNTAQTVALRKARDTVAKAQAALDKTLDGNQASGAHRELADTQRQLDQARQIQSETEERNRNAIDNARRDVRFSQQDVQIRQQRYDQIKNNTVICPLTPSVTNASNPCDDRFDQLRSAQRQLVSDQNSLRAAQHSYDVDHESQIAQVRALQLSVTAAQDRSDLNSTDRIHEADSLRADLDIAQADLVSAQKAFDATIMHSSVKGSVFKINGQVGQLLEPSHATAAAHGDAAPASADHGASGDQPLIVIKTVDQFQVSAPYTAAEAAQMRIGQPAEISFDTLPGLTRRAVVSSITPADPNVPQSNAIVLMTLAESDPRLCDGMPTESRVMTSSVDNVMSVPNAAVTRNGQSATVTVVSPDGGRTSTPVELGAIGTDKTEIRSGVRAGDTVALTRH